MTHPWPKTSIGEQFDIGAGKSVTPQARHGEKRHPFLRTSNVFWGRVDISSVDAMHFTDEEINSKSLQKGDLLVCEGGDIGRAAVWNGELENCSFQNHLHRLRPKNSDVLAYFYMYYLQAGFTQLGIYEGAGNKTTIPNLSRSRLASLTVPKPPKGEQAKIAAILLRIQEAIEVEEKLMLASSELRQTALEHLLTCGLRKFIVDMPIPKDWESMPLGVLIDVLHGYTFKSDYFTDEGPIVLTPGNFRLEGGLYYGKNTKFTSENCPDHFKFVGGELVMVMTDLTPTAKLLGSPGFIPSDKAILHNQRIGKVNIHNKSVLPEFLYFVFLSRAFKQYMLQTCTGSTVRHTSPKRIKDFEINLPPINEQKDIVSMLQKIEGKIDLHQKRKLAYEDLFQTFLSQLMLGTMSVTNLKIDTSDITY